MKKYLLARNTDGVANYPMMMGAFDTPEEAHQKMVEDLEKAAEVNHIGLRLLMEHTDLCDVSSSTAWFDDGKTKRHWKIKQIEVEKTPTEQRSKNVKRYAVLHSCNDCVYFLGVYASEKAAYEAMRQDFHRDMDETGKTDSFIVEMTNVCGYLKTNTQLKRWTIADFEVTLSVDEGILLI